MKRKQSIDDELTLNQLILRIMRLMEEVQDLKQHISGLNQRMFELSTNAGSQINSLAKVIQDCQIKQGELEDAFVKRSDVKPIENKIN